MCNLVTDICADMVFLKEVHLGHTNAAEHGPGDAASGNRFENHSKVAAMLLLGRFTFEHDTVGELLGSFFWWEQRIAQADDVVAVKVAFRIVADVNDAAGSVLVGYALLGACWLVMKTEGELKSLAVRWARRALLFTGAGRSAGLI